MPPSPSPATPYHAPTREWPGARQAYEIVIDEAAESAPAPPESRIVHLTTASRFAFAVRPREGGRP